MLQGPCLNSLRGRDVCYTRQSRGSPSWCQTITRTTNLLLSIIVWKTNCSWIKQMPLEHYRTPSKCRCNIYRISRKRRGTFRVVHKVERSSPTVLPKLRTYSALDLFRYKPGEKYFYNGIYVKNTILDVMILKDSSVNTIKLGFFKSSFHIGDHSSNVCPDRI